MQHSCHEPFVSEAVMHADRRLRIQGAVGCRGRSGGVGPMAAVARGSGRLQWLSKVESYLLKVGDVFKIMPVDLLRKIDECTVSFSVQTRS